MIDNIKQTRVTQIPGDERHRHEGYAYIKRDFVPINGAKQCAVAVYELLPGKSAYPYHYHTMNEEVFYILSGYGTLRTPEGEKPVSAGDIIYFPASQNGAHKLTNTSSAERLVYIDFDTHNPVDVAVYPDSDKIGIWGMNINKVFKAGDSADYFDGE